MTDRLRLNALRVMTAMLLLLAVVGVADRIGDSDAPDAAAEVPSAGGGSASLVPAAAGPDAASSTGGGSAPDPLTLSLVIDRMSSPAPHTARAEGRLRDAETLTVDVFSDGIPLDPVRIVPNASGGFDIEIPGLDPGPQSICLGEVCARVLVAEDTEPLEAIEARIAGAIERAATFFDFATHVPDWSIEATGPNSSAGGYAVEETKVIFISANSGRSDDDYLITVLHEIGHAVDFTYMTPQKREAYLTLRNLDPALPWGVGDELVLGDDRWKNSAEDFAEVFVAWALDGAYDTQTTAIAPQPSPEDLVAFCELMAVEGVTCS